MRNKWAFAKLIILLVVANCYDSERVVTTGLLIGKRLFHSRHNISHTGLKFSQGRDFYVRCFDFAFGECDYFPPLRVMAVTCAHKIVTLAFVSIRPLYEEHHGGAGRTAIHGLNLPSAHILCASPPFAYWADA